MLMTQTTAFGLGPMQQQQQHQQQHRKKKGRLYSLGGNEPAKRPRGRLDRLKTVGTFDLGTEMSAFGSLNAQIIGNTTAMMVAGGEALEMRNAVNSTQHSLFTNLISADVVMDSNKCTDNRELSESGDGTDRTKTTAATTILASRKVQRLKENEAIARTNYNKIELDMQSIEDISKCCDPTNENEVDAIVAGGKRTTFEPTTTTRKPILRKSKHIVLSDSDTHEENQPPQKPVSGRNEIVLQANYDIQIHQEPRFDEDDDEVDAKPSTNATPPVRQQSVPGRAITSVTTTNSSSSRMESSDLDEAAICSPTKDRMYKSADESSQNMSVDDIDTVFSDTQELEQLEREYRDILRSNLQREYKSDGDTLDEVGKKRAEFTTWKNQSFENTFEMYTDKAAAIGASPIAHNGTTSTVSETGSVSKMSDPTFKIKPILKTTSSRESTISSPASSSRPTQLKIDVATTDRPPSAVESKKEESKSTASLFEKRFGIRKINSLLKCKRFSTSALYDKKSSSSSAKNTSLAGDVAGGRHSTDTETLTFSPSEKPAGGSSGDSKSSLYSSKLSLFNYKAGRGLFGKRKPSMSNTELNEMQPKPIQRTRLTTDYTKSNSDLHGYKSAAGRAGKPQLGAREASVPPPVMSYRQPLHSPLSEEFYNPTGSVRLSAMELFEKFCSEDFGGLYKNEVTLNLSRRGGTCGEYQSLHEYRLGQRGLGVTQKYNRINNSRLLRQKSEPKFLFRDDAASSYFEEEDDEDVYDEGNEETGGEYEDEYGDEFELEEEEEEEEEELDEEEEEEEEEDELVEEDEDGLFGETEGNGAAKNEPSVAEGELAKSPESIQDSVAACDDPTDVPMEPSAHDPAAADVDEIFLMPAHSKCTDDYDEYGFENKQFTLEQTLMTRATSADAALDSLSGSSSHHSEIRTFALPQNVRVVREKFDDGDDEVLTIYKICSKDDTLTATFPCSPPPSQPPLPDGNDSSLADAVGEYVQNAPAEMVDVLDMDNIYRTDCLSMNQITSRSNSLDLLSSPSCTIRSMNTVTYPEHAFNATVQHLNLLDTCSTTSKMSLSLKSEIFDDLILTPDDAEPTDRLRVCVAKSCDFEDFRLTPDDSMAEGSEALANGTPNGATNGSVTGQELNSIVDKFLQMELSGLEVAQESSQRTSVSCEDANDLQDVALPAELADEAEEENVVSEFTTEITKEFDALFTRALLEESVRLDVSQATEEDATQTPNNAIPSIDTVAPTTPLKSSQNIQTSSTCNDGDEHEADSARQSPPLIRMKTRYSMQCLEPYLLVETVNGARLATKTTQSYTNGRRGSRSCAESPAGHAIVGAVGGGGAAVRLNREYCRVIDVCDGTFVQKRVAVGKLQSNRSQSLEYLDTPISEQR